QFADGAHDVTVFHVAAGIIVRADGKNAWMLAMTRLYDEVEVLKVIVIPGEDKQDMSERVQQMARVGISRGPDVGRDCHLMARFAQEGHQERLARIVIDVKVDASGW